jgi:hypothetical protein
MRFAEIATDSAFEDAAEDQALQRASHVDFDAPNLGVRADQLSQYELDHLPFSAILLDRDGVVKFCNATEAGQSGYGVIVIGQNLFKISRYFSGNGFRGRIQRAMESSPFDLEFGWPHGANDSTRQLRVRVLSSHSGDIWLFIDRDKAEAERAAAG